MSGTCFLCGGGESSYMCTKNGFDIVRCRTCGLVRVDPLPSPQQMEEYYREGYDQLKYSFSTPEEGAPAEKSPELKIVERFCAAGTLLDVGSAYGRFQQMASIHGWKTEGVEPQTEARDIARKRFGHVVHESLHDAPRGAFQVATLWHVIEHIASPKEFLLDVRTTLADAGILALATPNIDSVVAKATGRSWGWLSPPDHLFLYSPTTLPRLLDLAGFEMLHMETRRGQSRNFLLLMMQAAAYRLGLFQKVKQSVHKATEHYKASGSRARKMNLFWLTERGTNALSVLLTPALIVLWKAGLGDEVLAVARKKQ